MNDLVNELLYATNVAQRFREALMEISKETYRDDHDFDYKPTKAAKIAQRVLAEIES